MEKKETALLKLYGRKFVPEKPLLAAAMRVMSYNMLANVHVNQQLYRRHRLKDILAPRRQALIADEIAACRPDILCVQELQQGDLPAFAAAEALQGFERCFGAKRRPAGALPQPEGVAVFVRSARFRVRDRRVVNFDLRLGDNYDQGDALLAEMTKACTAVVLVIEGEGERRLAVASIHLPFNPKQGHVKLGALCLLFKTLARLCQLHDFADVIVCGDFNTVPNSMLYRFATERKADLAADLRAYSNQLGQQAALKRLGLAAGLREGDRRYRPAEAAGARLAPAPFLRALLQAEPCFGDEPAVRFEGDGGRPVGDGEAASLLEEISDQLRLASAYREVKGGAGPDADACNEAGVTFFGESMKGCVDYILYSQRGGLTPVRVLAPPPAEALCALDTTLPAGPFGSDHISLLADFAFKERPTPPALQ